MLTATSVTDSFKLPALPSKAVEDFIPYFVKHPSTSIPELLEPYKAFEGELRKIYAQQPSHEAIKDGNINLVPLFAGHEQEVKIRSRHLETASDEENSKYIMPLKDEDRKPDGAPAIVGSFKEFKENFNLFSESSLTDLDWSNVVAAGSAVTTALLPVPEKWAASKKSRREYYHRHLAPASDVDLFLYGLTEEQGREKIKQIERSIKDSILYETTTIRTKNAITIASQHPTRHVQIVLRLYDSISQIITGFDVDCACAAYDGKQVYAAPRAIAAFVTQCNTIDLKRRSPSYENRLSKYNHRGFEVYWPLLDRSQIDPTIFERSFGRTLGLARLLVLERLPKSADRDTYMDQRRAERGRPVINRPYRPSSHGNLKDEAEDEIAEWIGQEDVSSYHTMVVPYGPNYHAGKINRLLYAKDLLLNAEWNQPDDRKVYLHRHPCFFGTSEEVLEDCCGACPIPKTEEEIAIAEEENKIFISGPLKFIVDDPGRQEIGSFNPITDEEWTTMAYIGDTARLCQAITDGDLEHVEDWCSQDGVDVNRRDFTGRTPLHLAAMTSTPEIVQCLIDHGARLIARLVDGRTALHIAAARGNTAMVKALMNKSLANEEEEDKNEDARKVAREAKGIVLGESEEVEKENELENIDENDDLDSEASGFGEDSEEGSDSMTMGSFVKVGKEKPSQENADDKHLQDSPEDPDIYDINVIAWDYGLSPLHLAILNGHLDVIKLLVSEYGADVLLPVKLTTPNSNDTPIMTIILALLLPTEEAKAVVKLLLELGATSAQADVNRYTVFHYVVAEGNQDILDLLIDNDRPAALSIINNLGTMQNDSQAEFPLSTAVHIKSQDIIAKLLSLGAKPFLGFDEWVKRLLESNTHYARNQNHEAAVLQFKSNVSQPIITAAKNEMGKSIQDLLKYGADPSTLEKAAQGYIINPLNWYYPHPPRALLDIVQEKLKALREYKIPDQSSSLKPENLREEAFYTAGLTEGSYQHWSAQQNFQAEKRANEKKLDWQKLSKPKIEEGIEEKQAAIFQLIQELENAENAIIDAGGKTFADMYPDLSKRQFGNQRQNIPPTEPLPYETKLGFKMPDLNDTKKEGYFRLFEAAWTNDLDAIKALTLAPWSSALGNVQNDPLKISVCDFAGFSPFSIAVLRGHYELAKQIIDICRLQYLKEDGTSSKRRWTTIEPDSDSEYSDGEIRLKNETSFSLPIYSELVNDKFTTEILGEVSDIVKSDIHPMDLIRWACASQRFLDIQPKHTDLKVLLNNVVPRMFGGAIGQSLFYYPRAVEPQPSLMQQAVHANDMHLFKFIVELANGQKSLASEEEDDQKYQVIDSNLFSLAIKLGRTAMLAEMIKMSGVGIPFNDLIEHSGIEVKTKTKYYQGLSVGGKKNADWARHPDAVDHLAENKVPPVLQAAYAGSVESVEWFMSDAPLRLYKEYAENNKKDTRVKALEKSEKGFEKTIASWLNTKGELILHSAILSDAYENDKLRPGYLALLKHIISVMPSCLEQRNSGGWTPLQVAIYAGRPEAVAYLISIGANQRSRDIKQRNMVHSMLANANPPENAKSYPEKLQQLLELFDKEALKEMLLERCNSQPQGALTPLAYWMAKVNSGYEKPDIVKLLTKYGTGEELTMINGEGDLPLHVAIKHGLSQISSFLLELNPSLLYRENATGRTPLEMARDTCISKFVSSPRVIPRELGYSYAYGSDPRTLVGRPAASFVKKEEKGNSKKRTWEVCEEKDRKMERNGAERKRRLVSLFEANEVARRIQGRTGNGTGHQNIANGGLAQEVWKNDFVTQWMITL